MKKQEENKILYTFILTNNHELLDLKSIIYLYQPIIGLEAVSLYNYMIQESNTMKQFKNFRFTLNKILDVLLISQEKFEDLSNKLQAVSLIEQFKSKDSIVYKIYRPKDPVDFFQDEILNNALKNKISSTSYEMYGSIFGDDTPAYLQSTKFENATVKFSEVFPELTLPNGRDEFFDFSLKLRKSNPLLKGFDQSWVLKKLGESNIYIDKKDKEQINLIRNIYAHSTIENDVLVGLIVDSYDFEKQEIDTTIILQILSKYGQKINYEKKKKFKSEIENRKKEKINQMNEYDCEVFLSCLVKNRQDIKINNNVIDNVRKMYFLPDPVINCIIDYLAIKNNNVTEKEVYSLAEAISKKNILSLGDAMTFLKNIN